MNEKEFKKLLKKDRYQVFVFSSRLTLPLSFARHTWFVVSDKGKTSRWEVLFFNDYTGRKFGYLHLNSLKPTEGMGAFLFKIFGCWKGKLIGTLEGKKNSTAEKVNLFFKEDYKKYPYAKRYLLLGPNSNTFTQWVIDQFPKWNLKLPKNAFGKHYKPKFIFSPNLSMSHLLFQ